jgi:HPt (histidine-containing phosphotransfer) domain-containing protein
MSAPAPAPAVEIAQLKLMTGDDADLAHELIGIFRNQADLWGRLLDASADPTQWADACHTIKGAARSVGAMALGDACATAEALGRTGSTPAQAGVALSEVKDRMVEAIEELAAIEHRLAMGQGFPG